MTCRLDLAQHTSADDMGDQIVVSEDEVLIATSTVANTDVTTWSNTGLSSSTSTGLYGWTGTDSKPTGSTGSFDGLMVHPGLHKIYAFSYDSGSNYAFVFNYNESDPNDPLQEDSKGVVDISGSDGEEDTVIQSAHTVNTVSWTYLGCVMDDQGERVFDGRIDVDNGMTTEMCYGLCLNAGYAFFGTQYRDECWCTQENEDFEEHGAIDIAVCDMQCDGDADQICGGYDALSAYEIHESPVDDGAVIALVGAGGGVRRLTVDDNAVFGTASAFPDFGKDGSYDAKRVAFSPDGSTLYVASNDQLISTSSSGQSPITWFYSVSTAVCDIAVSPDGQSVYIVGCVGGIKHLRLDAPNGAVASIFSHGSSPTDVGGSDWSYLFRVEALEHSVVAARTNSDEIVIWQRDESSGVISSPTTTELGSEAQAIGGVIRPSPAPTLPPSPASIGVPTMAPTVPSTVPELVEAKLAAAVHGVDISFEPGPGGSGLWCHGVTCVGSTCDVAELLDIDTTASVGAGASCSWKEDTTVLVTFGQGYTLAENSTVTLNGDSEYISGCPECDQYASGSAVVQARAAPPQLASAQFTNTGAQVMVAFSGNPASQEINGIFEAVSCESVFSAASVAALGAGSMCQFMSSFVIQVSLGALPSIGPSLSETCMDGDGTSLTLLAGVVRTEIGAFLTSPSECTAVGPPSNPDPPFVAISAPGTVGNCDDLTLEGSTIFASIGTTNVTWRVSLAGGEQSVDTSNIVNVLEEANVAEDLRVTIPSDGMVQGSTYAFVLRADTALGGSGEAEVHAYKSSRELPISKVLGSAVIQRTRGSQIILGTETVLSSCSALVADEALASYSWSLLAANESRAGEQLTVEAGRDPRVLSIPPYTLGYAGSSYVFQFRSVVGDESATTANATVEIVSGAIVATITGGSRRTLGVSQALLLDASESLDEDNMDDEPFEFGWYCESSSGGVCLSRTGEALLDPASSTHEASLFVPAGSFPVGVEYIFTVTVSKGFDTGPVWSPYRSDNASCFVSTSWQDTPLVSISPKETRRKYNPSSRLILYGCAATSIEDRCSNRTGEGFDFEWEQTDGNLEVSQWGNEFGSQSTLPTLVIRPGALSPGRSYTFSMTATGLDGGVGYSEYSFETNTAPIGGYVDVDLRQITAGQDVVTLKTMAWIDDFDDLPMVYEFGYTHGWHEVLSVSSGLWTTMVSIGASSSSQLRTYLPPGKAQNGLNITVVAYVSDKLGARGVTSLNVDGIPLAIVSTIPDQVSVSSLRSNISSLSAVGGSSLVDPADALREAAAVSSVLEYAPEPESAEELAALVELKEAIVSVVAESYLALNPTQAAARAGAEALAAAVTSCSEGGPMNDAVAAVVSDVVTDMIKVSTLNGQVLNSGVALSMLQTVSALFDGSNASAVPAGSTSVAGNEGALDMLGSLGRAMAIGNEAGEDVDEVSTGTINLRAAKVAQSSIPSAVVAVGENGTQVSFGDWDVAEGVEDNSTLIVAVASIGTFASEDLQGVTSIDAWDTMSDRLTVLDFPVSFVTKVARTEGAGDGVTAMCVVWSDTTNEWVIDGVIVESIVAEPDGTWTITCSTFHLSLFAIADEEAPSGGWAAFRQLAGVDVLQQYGAESWPAILFLGLVAVLFLVPAALLYFEEVKAGVRQQFLEDLRSTYLDKGRCSRADQPVKVRVKDRMRTAHEVVGKNNQLESGYLQVHTISTTTQKDNFFKTVAVSVFMNHAWNHLRSGPAAHFKKTLLTRSQHVVTLLADWMSAVALQAVFYGKSQATIQAKAKMTAVTALFMIPTAWVFPALLRKANTPPSSATLSRSRRDKRQVDGEKSTHIRDGRSMRHLDRPNKDQSEQVSEADPRSGTQGSLRESGTPFEGKYAHSTQARRREKKLRALTERTHEPIDRAKPEGVSADKTRIYRDTVRSQQVMVVLYLFLPVWTALLVPMVFEGLRAAKQSPGRDQDAQILRVTASLAIICALLCVLAVYGVGTRRVDLMAQVMAFQALVGPGLVLCGAMLYGSSASLATGAAIGGLGLLLCAYFLRLQRLNEVALQAICREDLITTWSHPSPAMQSAARLVQGKFRMHLAKTRAIRALEFRTWLDTCKGQRFKMYVLANSVVCLTILCLTYTNLVFAARFDRETCTNWLTTCVIALVVEAAVQQPVVLLMTGVLGDFVEDGADFLLEVLDF
eukprot:g10779.t1